MTCLCLALSDQVKKEQYICRGVIQNCPLSRCAIKWADRVSQSESEGPACMD